MGVAYRQKSIYLNDDWQYQQHYLMEAIKAYKEAVKILKKIMMHATTLHLRITSTATITMQDCHTVKL